MDKDSEVYVAGHRGLGGSALRRKPDAGNFHLEILHVPPVLIRPDGTPRKLLEVTRILDAGWKPHTPPRDGIRRRYAWFLNHVDGALASDRSPSLTGRTR